MSKDKVRSNIWKLYLIRGLRCFMLTVPVIVLFFQENGLSMQQIFLLQAFFSLAVIVLEIPSGYFSDVFGRKRSIVFGGGLAFVGFATYSQSHGFWGFLLAEVILGVGVSFVSGADCAMLYDTLLQVGEEAKYKKVEGRGAGVGLFSESFASVIGGFLALVSLRFPLYWDALVSLLIVPVSLTLVEPQRQMLVSRRDTWKNMLKLVKFSLHDHKQVKWLIIYSSLVASSTLTMFWFIQPYLLATKVPLGLFGVILAGLLLCASFCSWNVERIESFLGKEMALWMLVLLPALGYFLLSSFWFVWSAAFLLPFYFVRGINAPVMLDHINGLISSDTRATILSVKNLVSRLIFSAFGPFAGWVSDTFSLKAALLTSGATFFTLGVIALLFVKKHKKV